MGKSSRAAFVAFKGLNLVRPTTKPTPNPDVSGVDHNLWDYLLRGYVENGLVDYGESNPTLSDSDGDGCDDGTEINEMGTDPLNEDNDEDGFSDCEEFLNNSDPLNGSSYPLGKYKGSGCTTVSTDSQFWLFLIGVVGCFSTKRRRKYQN